MGVLSIVLYPGALCYEVFTNVEVVSNSAVVSTALSTVPLKKYPSLPSRPMHRAGCGRSFVPQRHRRIDARRTPGWQVTGRQSEGREHRGHGGKGRRIGGPDAVEQTGGVPGD